MLPHEALRVCVIGPGRLGLTLVASLRRAGVAVPAVVPSPGSSLDAAAEPPRLALAEAIAAADVDLDRRARRRHRDRGPRVADHLPHASRTAHGCHPLERPWLARPARTAPRPHRRHPGAAPAADLRRVRPAAGVARGCPDGRHRRHAERRRVRLLAGRAPRRAAVRPVRRREAPLPPGGRRGEQPVRGPAERGGRAHWRRRRACTPAAAARAARSRWSPRPPRTSPSTEPVAGAHRPRRARRRRHGARPPRAARQARRHASPTPTGRSRCRRCTWPLRGSTTRPSAPCASCSTATRDGYDHCARSRARSPQTRDVVGRAAAARLGWCRPWGRCTRATSRSSGPPPTSAPAWSCRSSSIRRSSARARTSRATRATKPATWRWLSSAGVDLVFAPPTAEMYRDRRRDHRARRPGR